MRWIVSTLLAAALVVAGACGSSITPVQPPLPTPAPSPSPRLLPLTVEGSSFATPQGPLYLAGAVVCCEGYPENGWPLISEAYLRQLAEAKANYTHIRLGPFMAEGESPEFVAYETMPDGRVDLDKWNPSFWARVRSVFSLALALDIYVEADLTDGWLLKHPEIHPWSGGNNANGVHFTLGKPFVRQAPPDIQVKWVEKILDETSHFPNVIYQVSNESFVLDATPEWELPIIDLVHRRGRLAGTNSHNPFIEAHADYVNYHMTRVPNPIGKPLMVNEYDSGQLPTPSGYESFLQRAYERGVMFHLWRGNMSEAAWRDALARLRKFREAHP